jgi:hypothetical protein
MPVVLSVLRVKRDHKNRAEIGLAALLVVGRRG